MLSKPAIPSALRIVVYTPQEVRPSMPAGRQRMPKLQKISTTAVYLPVLEARVPHIKPAIRSPGLGVYTRESRRGGGPQSL